MVRQSVCLPMRKDIWVIRLKPAGMQISVISIIEILAIPSVKEMTVGAAARCPAAAGQIFKLTRYLMELTGEAGYGSWAEKLLYNGCGGQPPITQDGKVMYYADYFINGGLKSTEDGRLQDNGASFEWQCCTGTFPQDVAEYAQSFILIIQKRDCLSASICRQM